MLLAVLALLVPKEKELALLAVEEPNRPPPPPGVALFELAPNVDWAKEKPPDVPLLLAGWPKPLTVPNMDLPKPAPADVPNPDELNPVDAGAEEAGGAAGCPNTVLAAVAGALLTTTGVVVVAAGAAVLTTGVAATELLSVIAGVGWVKMEPGFSAEGTWNAAGATWETGVTVATVEEDTGAAVVEASGVASSVEGKLACPGGVASACAVMLEGGSGIGAAVAKGSAGIGAAVSVVVASTVGTGATGRLLLSTAGSAIGGSFSGGGVGSEDCGGAFGSSDDSEEAERRLLKDVGNAEAPELDKGAEKAGLIDSGGLNKLPDAATLDKSAVVESSADF